MRSLFCHCKNTTLIPITKPSKILSTHFRHNYLIIIDFLHKRTLLLVNTSTIYMLLATAATSILGFFTVLLSLG